MEGGMPSMVQNLVGDGIQTGDGRNELHERQLVEKLEKSEAGRKKLRQAIVLLKEKLDATSQALEVNEALRQEVEKERLNVETERKRAETEKTLRAKVEEENVSIKEQFVGVLQRLDSLESTCKADRSEFHRIRSEVKEGIGAALQAVEATQGLFQSLERSLHSKINGAVQSSSKALALAQSGQATTSRAQAVALAAQSLAKSVQKDVQLVSSQVVALQKQASNLSALEAVEPQLKGPRTPLNSPDAGESNVSLVVPKEKVSIDASSPNEGTVLSKTQGVAEKSSQDKDEGDIVNMLVASTDKSRSNPMCSSSNGLPPRGGMFLSRNQIPDGGLKSTIPPVRLGANSPRKGSVEMVSRDESIPGSSSLRKGPVAIITGVDSILSPAVRVPETVTKSSPSSCITSPSTRANAVQKQTEVQPQKFGDATRSREYSNKRPTVKRGRGDPNVVLFDVQRSKSSTDMAGKQIACTAGLLTRNVACNTVDGDVTLSEGMPPSDIKPYPSSTSKLLKSVIKMFEKEGRNRRSMEEKLMKLQGALDSHFDPGQVALIGTKRKREASAEQGDGALVEKGKKRHRQGKEAKNKVANLSLDDAVTSPTCTAEDKHPLQEKVSLHNDIQTSGDGEPAQDRLSEMIISLQGKCRGEGLFETIMDCQVNKDVPAAEECKDASSDVDICDDDVSKDETGTNTDLESTDDDLGEDWWAKKVLLSPISNIDLTS